MCDLVGRVGRGYVGALVWAGKVLLCCLCFLDFRFITQGSSKFWGF